MNVLYRIEDIAAHINKEADGKVMIFVLKNGICSKSINRPMWGLMVLPEHPGGKYFAKGDNDVFF